MPADFSLKTAALAPLIVPGPQILHVDTGADILDLLSQESWEKWKAQAEKFRKATPMDPSDKSEKDTKASKNSFLSIFRCGRASFLV